MQRMAIMASPDAPGNCSLLQMTSCLQTLTILMNLVDKPLPRILVMHVSRKVAAAFGVDGTGVIRHNRPGDSDMQSYYELWLVGRPEVSSYILALLGILEDHFLLEISSDDRQRALESATWAASAKSLASETVQ